MSAEYTFTVEREIEDGAVIRSNYELTVHFDTYGVIGNDDVSIDIVDVYVTFVGMQHCNDRTAKLPVGSYDKDAIEELCWEYLAQQAREKRAEDEYQMEEHAERMREERRLEAVQ
ncbi:hypothetical protein K7G19_07445 [Cupriavidus sp. DB3]|uniref:hypothetical protein n=1 Tax=Cupriavidus sp. DB3 TaxID=2873259 RepID=UPI001CF461D0|nr:hypothetical protein [Cupriavidus sp. DB3]MCA7083433.1 hypothetical protein [Cupriavidus sp. DB3]